MYLFLPGSLVFEQVHVHSEGDVLDHDKHVCHGDAGEDEVDGVPPHVLMLMRLKRVPTAQTTRARTGSREPARTGPGQGGRIGPT